MTEAETLKLKAQARRRKAEAEGTSTPSAAMSQPEMTFGQAWQQGKSTAFNQALQVPSAVLNAAMDPVGTAKAAGNIATGTANLIQGAGALAARPGNAFLADLGLVPRLAEPTEQENTNMEMARQVGRDYAEDYGSWEGFKNHLATEPFQLAGDAATVLSAGAGAMAKGPALASKVSMLSKQPWAVRKMLAIAAPKNLTEFDKLGPDAMVLDATPSTVGLAQGAAMAPTEAKNIIVEALKAREAAKSARLIEGTKQTLGKMRDPVLVKALVDRAAKRKSAPLYKQAKSGAPQFIQADVDAILKTHFIDPAQKLAPDGRKVIYGVVDDIDDAMKAGSPDLVAERLHNVRMDMDHKIEWDQSKVAEMSSADKVANAHLKEARKGVDALLKSIPGFADADAFASAGAKAKEAVDLGFGALSGGKYVSFPERFAKDAAKLDPQFVREGMKGDIGTAMGTQANDLSALRKKIGGDNDFNRAKIASQFGQGKVDALVDMVDREGAFSSNYSDVARGSQTAPRAAAAEMVAPKKITTNAGLTWTGAVVTTAAKALNRLLSRGATAYSSSNANALAKVLTLKGPEGRQLLLEVISKTENPQLTRKLLKSIAITNAGAVASGASQ